MSLHSYYHTGEIQYTDAICLFQILDLGHLYKSIIFIFKIQPGLLQNIIPYCLFKQRTLSDFNRDNAIGPT